MDKKVEELTRAELVKLISGLVEIKCPICPELFKNRHLQFRQHLRNHETLELIKVVEDYKHKIL